MMNADDPLLDAPSTAAPTTKRTRKPPKAKAAKVKAVKATAPKAEKPKAKAKKTPKAKKAPAAKRAVNPDSKWHRAKNFDEIKAKVKAAVSRRKEPVAIAELATSLGFDTNNVRWASRALEKEGAVKTKLSKNNRLEVRAA